MSEEESYYCKECLKADPSLGAASEDDEADEKSDAEKSEKSDGDESGDQKSKVEREAHDHNPQENGASNEGMVAKDGDKASGGTIVVFGSEDESDDEVDGAPTTKKRPSDATTDARRARKKRKTSSSEIPEQSCWCGEETKSKTIECSKSSECGGLVHIDCELLDEAVSEHQFFIFMIPV